jgi:hypothetical protein
MNWGQTLVIAAALLVAGVAFSTAQTNVGSYNVSGVSLVAGTSMAWVTSPAGEVWLCKAHTDPPSCVKATVP